MHKTVECETPKYSVSQEIYFARSLCEFLYNKFPTRGKVKITIDDNNDLESIEVSFQNTDKEELLKNIQKWVDIMYGGEVREVSVFVKTYE